MTLLVEDERWLEKFSFEVWQERADALMCQVLLKEKINPSSDVTIVLSNDTTVQELNKTYRQKDQPTNVLSFPLMAPQDLYDSQEPCYLGDIILAYETVSGENPELFNHTSHLMVHGLFHLLGFDHIDDAEAEVMEKKETEILTLFSIPNPYE
jgi:probable rRNA maturation factor